MPVEKFSDYQLKGRTIEGHRSTIRKFIGFNKWGSQYANELSEWVYGPEGGYYYILHIKAGVVDKVESVRDE